MLEKREPSLYVRVTVFGWGSGSSCVFFFFFHAFCKVDWHGREGYSHFGNLPFS